jgi:hypothetical protein
MHAGDSHTYVWKVPERAGPGAGDPSSLMWMYHSHANEVSDTSAGLFGAAPGASWMALPAPSCSLLAPAC